MNAQTRKFFIPGTAGQIECAIDLPDGTPSGLALLAHPHPLFGGTMDNKVIQTLARTFVGLGYVTARMNFRGVGRTQGVHDEGRGETDDMAALLASLRKQYPGLPLALGGFSFGTFVQSQLQQRLIEQGAPAERLVLVSVTAKKWAIDTVPENTILIHGEQDDVVPLADVFDWARPQDLPVVVVTGANHLFDRKLHHIRDIVSGMWHR